MMRSEASPFVLTANSMDTGKSVSDSAATNWEIDPTVWVDEHGDYLFRYAIMRLRDDAQAEDLVQETLLAAIQSMKSYGGKSTERTWLTSILKHKIIDHYRKVGREKPLDEEVLDLSEFDKLFERSDQWNGHWNNKLAPMEWNMSPEQVFEQTEFFEVLQNCLSKLPEKVAGVFALREMDGLDSSEICEVLALSANNFWVIMHRARMSLRRCIELNWFKKLK